ncbi:MAG: GspE/PulE family protein [Candidatus Sumerlaeia bacterium]
MAIAFGPSDSKPVSIDEMLLREKIISPDQLKRAKRVQSKLEIYHRITDVLVQLGYVTQSQIREAMRKSKQDLRLGDFLLEMKLVNQDQLDRALQAQKRSGKRLGYTLCEMGFLDEHGLCNALAEQFDCPIIEPDLRMVDKKLIEPLSIRFLKNYGILPFSKSEEGAVIIMHDPLDQECLKAAAQGLQCKIIPALSTKSQIEAALDSVEAGVLEFEEAQAGVETPNNIIRIVDELIRSAIEADVSDIHVEPLAKKVRVRYRQDGVLIHKTDIPKDLQDMLLSRFKILSGMDIAERRRHQDGKISYDYFDQTYDLRMSTYVSVYGETVVLRVLSQKHGIRELAELGFCRRLQNRYIHEVLEPSSGVVVMTGPTGSGKTTSLYSSIAYSNDPSIKIITAEEPVEYVIEGVVQCSVRPEFGLTFGETLKAIVRQDPDIIVLGEIRDKTTAEVAIEAALTGHKVFSTFHTEDSIGGIVRLIDMDIETFLISSTVLSILAQRLLRRICLHCKELYEPTPFELMRIGVDKKEAVDYEFFRGRGCEHCNHTGYRGRVGVYELLVMNEAIRDAVLQKKTAYEIRRISVEETGLLTLLEDGISKVVSGITTIDEVRKHIPYVSKPRKIDTILGLTEVK